MDDSAMGGYHMILVQYLLTELELNFKLFDHFIKSDDGNVKGYITPMVDLGMY